MNAEYVDMLNDRPVLIPRHDALAIMRVKRCETLADGIMDSAIVVHNERTRPANQQEAGNITQHSAAVSRALAHAAAQLGKQEWCEGTGITLAYLALACALVYLDLRLPELGWRVQHKDLATWFARTSVRPSMRTLLAD